MLNILTNRNDPVTIGSLELEVTLSEDHNYTNQITDYPIESGSNISDHVQKKPEQITITGKFSNSPIPVREGSLDFFIKGAGENRVNKALEDLLTIAGYALPKQGKGIQTEETTVFIPEKVTTPLVVDIVSILRIYTNMICTQLTFNIRQTTGQGLDFTAGFKRIETVESEIVSIDAVSPLDGKAPNVENAAPSTKNRGKQDTKPKSLAKSLYDKFGGK